MRIVIYGTGAVGGYYGARLLQAGAEVAFVARGRQLEALRARGLTVESVAGDVHLEQVTVTDDVASLSEADAVLVTTKAWQVKEAARAIALLARTGAMVVPLQNGVEAAAELEGVLGRGPVAGGLTRILSTQTGAGRIRHAGMDPVIVLGERDGRISGRCSRLAEVIRRAPGVSVEVTTDIEAELWKKFVFICAWGGVGAVTRVPVGTLMNVAAGRAMLRRSMEEITAVAAARGVRLPEGIVNETLNFLDHLPAQSTASIQRDIARGRPSELRYQSCAVVRLGGEEGVDTPLNRFICDALLPSEQLARSRPHRGKQGRVIA